MKKIKSFLRSFLVFLLMVMVLASKFAPADLQIASSLPSGGFEAKGKVKAESEEKKKNYFTIYNVNDSDEVVLVKGEGVDVEDEYLSQDNKLWKIVEVDNTTKTGKAEFLGEEQLPKYNVKKKVAPQNVVKAKTNKKVGVYHTHNDESYYTNDGYDSIYGEGGIHDVGKKFVEYLNSLGIDVIYREDLHLPHNSGAYTRSQVTASAILNTGGVDALFDLHRDSTPRSEFITSVDGVEMSKVRMVIGTANQNYYENREFAYAIKAYADEVYPGLIKDIYMGKGNYNQQLLSRGMLFEMGCENIEKSLVLKSTKPLAKVVDVVLYGSSGASEESLNDVELVDSTGKASVITGIAYKQSTASISFVWILLASIAFYFAVLGIVCIFSKTARYKTKRFFSELFAVKK